MTITNEKSIAAFDECLSLNAYEHANYAFRQVVFSKLKHPDLIQNHCFMLDNLKKLQQSKLAAFNRKFTQYDPADSIIKMKEFTRDEISSENFKKMLLPGEAEPFVVRGFLKDYPAVKKWNLNFFKNAYSDQKVIYDTIKNNVTLKTGITGKLSEVIQTIQDKSPIQKYMHNANDIFRCNRELLEDINLQELAELFKGCKNGVIQLFFGGAKTGTGWHSGTDSNAFKMIHGKKKWFFMHPKFGYVLTPDCQDVKVPKSFIPWHKSVGYLNEHYPLYVRTPKYIVDLEPGDMVIFKAWWWHAITNLTDTSIGCVTRWIDFKEEDDLIESVYPLQEYIAKSDEDYIKYGFSLQNLLTIGELVSDAMLKEAYTKSFL